MATLNMRTYPAERSGAFVQVSVTIGADNSPFPPRTVEIKRAADAEAAFSAYCGEAEAAGAKCVASMSLGRGDRSPPGFKSLKGASGWHEINL